MPSRSVSVLASIAVLFVIILAAVLSRPTMIEDFDIGLSFREQCRTEATANCITANTLPPTWSLLRNVTEGGSITEKSCAHSFPSAQCVDRILEGFS